MGCDKDQNGDDINSERFQLLTAHTWNFNTVITTLSAHAQQQDLLASTRGSVATNLVEVYKALGGGWEIREDRDPVDFLPAAMKDEMRERTRAWKGVLQ